MIYPLIVNTLIFIFKSCISPKPSAYPNWMPGEMLPFIDCYYASSTELIPGTNIDYASKATQIRGISFSWIKMVNAVTADSVTMASELLIKSLLKYVENPRIKNNTFSRQNMCQSKQVIYTNSSIFLFSISEDRFTPISWFVQLDDCA